MNGKRNSIALAMSIILLTGCSTGTTTAFRAPSTAPSGDEAAPTPEPTPTCAMPEGILTAAVDDLLWTSESDYPWEYWDVSEMYETVPTVEEFLSLIDAVGDPVEVRELDEYLAFASTIREEMEPAEVASAIQYQELIRILKETYPEGVVVYKVGTIQVNVFIVGISCGRPSGIRTISIET